MSGKSDIRDVSDTAFWVAHYRAEESARPDAMFKDPLAARLVGDRGPAIARAFGPTSKYTAWSVVTRTVMIDEYIQSAIKDGVDAVLNLGAGLDTRPYRLDLPVSFPWVEADFPHMVGFKDKELRDQAPRCKLQRIGVNLADDGERRTFLATVLPGAHRVLVLTEGVVPYLSEEQVAALAADLRSQPRFAGWIAEYFSPHMYRYLERVARSERMKNAPFRFFPRDWLGFFSSQGWEKRDITYTGDIAQRFNRTPPIPWWARLLVRVLPAEARERMRTSTGYVLMTPRS